MNVLIIGSEGIVGSALKFGFELLGHKIFCHDIKFKTKLETIIVDNEELRSSNALCFICVPTPKQKDGSCNISIVNDIIKELDKLSFKGIVVIKSTVPIGTTEKLIKKYKLQIAFNPEFLKERSAIIDFTERQDICIIGTNSKIIFKKIKKVHGHFPKKFIKVSPSEAEACKYFNNSLGATLVTFANSFYELCNTCKIDYKNVKDAISNREFVPKTYLDVNDKWRGWAGTCWSKDIPAITHMLKDTNIDFFKYLITENEKYIKTVPPGMRKE